MVNPDCLVKKRNVPVPGHVLSKLLKLMKSLLVVLPVRLKAALPLILAGLLPFCPALRLMYGQFAMLDH